MRLIVSRAAAADIGRLQAFLSEHDPKAAQAVVTALSAAVDSLADFPDRGRPLGIVGLRELIVPFGRSAYVLRYFHSQRRDAVVILRIWHGREKRD